MLTPPMKGDYVVNANLNKIHLSPTREELHNRNILFNSGGQEDLETRPWPRETHHALWFLQQQVLSPKKSTF